jgi:hypothetical protein
VKCPPPHTTSRLLDKVGLSLSCHFIVLHPSTGPVCM